MSKKEPRPVTRTTEYLMVGGPLAGKVRAVMSGETRVYVVSVRPEVLLDYEAEANSGAEVTDLFRYGIYELHKDYQRRDVLRWVGWEEEIYERQVVDRASPDYHG